jgi:hypothetical protein
MLAEPARIATDVQYGAPGYCSTQTAQFLALCTSLVLTLPKRILNQPGTRFVRCPKRALSLMIAKLPALCCALFGTEFTAMPG